MDRSLISHARAEMTPARGDLAALKRNVMAMAAGGAVVAAASTAKAAVSPLAKAGAATTAGATTAVAGVVVKSAGVGLAAKFGVVAVVASFGIAGTAVVGGMMQRGSSRGDERNADAAHVATRVEKTASVPRASAPVVNVGEAATALPVVMAPVQVVAPIPVAASTRAEVPAEAPAAEEEASVVVETDSIRVESNLLREAHRALAGGDAARALQLLDANAEQLAGGILDEERAALHARALCAAGRADEGRAEAATFVATHPNSMQRARLEGDCQ